ncbi:hypothetical protein SAMD00023353_1501420 [Rosellinia necatrix]|uniref:SWR1-complex protein 3 domain-containing protein n=1 Tax=Rosellinia necatrix TaxID=77044 RepID=A0A1W2TIS7_ROSNE|nr:hypothetical protein SAMD00023353_1501420 [Rosellinia necatrix]
MERKRKLPARAAARVEHVSKKRNSTPPDASATTSASPSALTSPQPAEHAAQEAQPPPSASAVLPKSLQPGHPLPTVEKPQPDDISNKDFQSIQESGVIAESLSRSRQKWIHDGIFEKYWSKPSKRKGVVKEDSNNPAKDTMTKIGQVTITIEPHLLEATLYAVKDPKPPSTGNSTMRPMIQYGPPNGAMPPPPKPATAAATTSAATSAATPATTSRPPSTMASPSVAPVQATQPAQPLRHSVPPSPAPKDDEIRTKQQPPTTSAAISSAPPSQQTELQRPQPPAPMDNAIVSPRGLESVLAAPQPAHAPLSGPAHPRSSQPPLSQPPTASINPLHAPTAPAPPHPHGPSSGLQTGVVGVPKATPPPPKPAPSPASGADPIIVTLAERASEDPLLRDLMKRVAVGDAAPHELAHFQKIIDQITLDYKKKGGQQGPSADRLIVDGRTVKYFSDEVRNILDIILASNPNQRSADLRPPPGSDPVVILLVKEALDKPVTRGLVQRVAEGKPKFSDALELKAILDRLSGVAKQAGKSPQTATATTSATTTTNAQAAPQATPVQMKGEDNSKKSPTPAPNQTQNTPTPQQALRSKGPPPAIKPDISAVVLEFAGGTGDRYLFPKYSILEFSADGAQVVASFLIVRKGSKLEYGGDRALDFYQPVTLRLNSNTPKALENLGRVVAPQDEVQRYMDDVMENMTRAEYVLLAMRLPRAEKEEAADESSDTPRGSETSHPTQLQSVLWDNRPTPTKPTSGKSASAKSTSEDAQYQSFIGTVS